MVLQPIIRKVGVAHKTFLVVTAYFVVRRRVLGLECCTARAPQWTITTVLLEMTVQLALRAAKVTAIGPTRVHGRVELHVDAVFSQARRLVHDCAEPGHRGTIKTFALMSTIITPSFIVHLEILAGTFQTYTVALATRRLAGKAREMHGKDDIALAYRTLDRKVHKRGLDKPVVFKRTTTSVFE